MSDTLETPAADQQPETWRRFLHADSYGLVLILTLGVFMLPAVVPDGQPWRTLIIALACLSVLVSLHTSRVPPWVFWGALVCAALAIVQSGFEISFNGADGVVSVTMGVLLIGAPIAILRRLVRHSQVTLRTLLGAIDVYLQIGIAFSFIFQAIEHFSPDAFPGLDVLDRAAFGYFSFVTLATLGYGDIVATQPVARNLAVLETIIGQVFLVVVVARVVTLLGPTRRPTSDDNTRRPEIEQET